MYKNYRIYDAIIIINNIFNRHCNNDNDLYYSYKNRIKKKLDV